ncbi:glycosyltransferase (plasmid) [Sinorhizobium garamanticum]|uniref:Glycosyltransferase n=1 Tax=Sinorhizobium garamanticum TaxID=680247 RepID=A0ABY8DLC2_9HYPH|nr:glycosyltransferase [Sinorhizobium garamanticum]WEX91699.1 glycosyltransferase [Sinorhizobium garamanticum]
MNIRAGAIFVSFDAVAVSGVTVEAFKVAKNLARNRIKSYLDLGYDIKIDKGKFNKPYDYEKEIYSDILTLVRVDDIDSVPYYNVSFIEHSHNILISGKTTVSSEEQEEIMLAISESSRQLAHRIVQLWEGLNISYVIVENGTLPENIIYTKALYLAIDAYGKRHGLGNFVIWRDHDLMWNSEKTVMKYGLAPYPDVVKPIKSNHITYITLNNHLKNKLEAWCHHEVEIKVKKNTYDFTRQGNYTNIRKNLSVRDNDILIARTTRIIPQKRIDRDIYLVHRLNQRFLQDCVDRKVFLVVAGDPHEDSTFYQELRALAKKLNIESFINFIGTLQHKYATAENNTITIDDLYYTCDLVSFLTSWDYDSYGNPIGEAISFQRCYITTSYEYYWEVYGQYGFEAPVMAISEERDGLPDEAFINDLYEFVNNKQRMNDVAMRNFCIGRQVLSDNVIDIMDFNSFEGDMRDNVFVSIVLPVYNESNRINDVLLSLFNQKTYRGMITHESYELIIVDNNSTDDSVEKINAFNAQNPLLDIHIIKETVQGVSSARKRGMDYASSRSKARDSRLGVQKKHYIVSADADCTVDPYWLHALIEKMVEENGDLGTCNYYYNEESFRHRPNLFREIQKTLRCRDMSFSLFGGFPDGKGFAVERTFYDKVGGIEIFYQLNNGRFVEHLSDDWDFGIRVIAWGGNPVYARDSRVEINSRRLDTILEEVITGTAYGQDGIIIMKDVRPDVGEQRPALCDTTPAQSQQVWFYSIKDYIPKNVVLPALLNPQILLENPAVREFFTGPVADRLYQRIREIKHESRIIDFKAIHAYKTPAYRLYFEFCNEIFSALRRAVGEDIGFPPPLPACFYVVKPEEFERFVYYFCEDRESGEAHNYFANGGVF